MSGSDSYEDYVKRVQAKAMADLKADMNRMIDRLRDPIRRERELFRAQISRARYRKGLSRSQLAAKINVRQPDISRIENGKANPGLDTLLKMAKVLDVSIVVE